MNNIDVLYLGVNMGNAGYRFFPRYPEAKKDYYDTFHWLIRLKKEYPLLNIAIKHHPGDYEPNTDKEEASIIRGRIKYIDNKLNSYLLAQKSRICVSYCSTMILELNEMPNLGHYLYNTRHKRFHIRQRCVGNFLKYNSYNIPAYFLDPSHRNRQFCMYADDVNIHHCEYCANYDLEIYEPLRLCSYIEFKDRVKITLDK